MSAAACASALYEGEVVHRRLAPRAHRHRYRLFQLLVDVDEAPELGRRLALFGHNRAAPLSLWDRDHLAGDDTPLARQARAMLAGADVEADGPVRLLAMPRVLGHVFNPLSIFYCHRRSGELAAAILEVHNTFGQRHCYLLPADPAAPGPILRRRFAKRFFVSPFMDLDMSYDVRLALPGAQASTAILARGPNGAPMLAAAFCGVRRPLTDATLARALLAHPFLTRKVVSAIHWEAARLFAKGLRLRARPPPPASPVSLAS